MYPQQIIEKAIKERKDPYIALAAFDNSIDYSEVTKDQRREAKNSYWSLMYTPKPCTAILDGDFDA